MIKSIFSKAEGKFGDDEQAAIKGKETTAMFQMKSHCPGTWDSGSHGATLGVLHLQPTSVYVGEGCPDRGTYTWHHCIFPWLAGCMTKSSKNDACPVMSVLRETESQSLPNVGAIGTCKISRINSLAAKVHSLYVGSTSLNSFRGTIHEKDAQATQKDKAEIYEFLPS